MVDVYDPFHLLYITRYCMLFNDCLQAPGKVRPRTSAWYYLCVEATRTNLILPDLPGSSGKIGVFLVASTYNYYKAEVRGRTFPGSRVTLCELLGLTSVHSMNCSSVCS